MVKNSTHGSSSTPSKANVAAGGVAGAKTRPKPISGWLIGVLKIAAVYNIVAGLSMMIFYHEGFKSLGIEKTDFNLPIQLVGCLVAIFGIGYWIVAKNPVENRNVLLLGFLSKLLGPLLAIIYIAKGLLPIEMLGALFFADTIYLLPFWMTYRRACKLSQWNSSNSQAAPAASFEPLDPTVEDRVSLKKTG